MKIKGFNLDILELYYISNLLRVKPGDKDIYHCSVYLACKHNLMDTIIQRIKHENENTNGCHELVQCIKNLLVMDPSYDDFIEYKKAWNIKNPEMHFALVMVSTAQVIAELLGNLANILLESEPDGCEQENVLRNSYGLNDEQIELIRFTYFTNNFRYVIFDSKEKLARNIITIISEAIQIPYTIVAENLLSDSKLIITRLIFYKNEEYRDYKYPHLADNVVYFIQGTVSKNDLINKYSIIDDSPIYPLKSFPVDCKQTDIINLMLSSERPFQILLYGEPGTGKTEYAKSIITSLGKRPRFVLNGIVRINEKADRLWSLHVSLNIMTKDDILIIDEADNMLNTEGHYKFDKGRLNLFFDTITKPIIWITNDIENIHPSLLRRFSFSVRFEPMRIDQREKIWKTEAYKHSILLTDEHIRTISQRFNVNAAGISHAAKVVALLSDKTGENLPTILNRILGSHSELIHGGKRLLDNGDGVDEFNADFLNTDIPIERIIKAGSFYTDSSFERYGKRGLCALFYGLPGTGKTETAKYIARQLNMKLIQKRYSDLVTKWVGETESKIANAFREAEEQNGILFIDEADTFFSERTGSRNSWEITRTNEFLSQIESFKRILICCTNLIDLLDSAVYRRFAFKVSFMTVKEECRIPIYLYFFGTYGELLPEQHSTIKKMVLTAGDLRAVATSIIYEDNINHEMILKYIAKENSLKKRKIGF